VRLGWVHTNNGVINGVLTVPISAVIKEGANYYVNIPGSNGSPQRVQFSAGAVGFDYVEVTGGLEEGQSILMPAPPR
jgi:HlyD family secretion protein